MNNDLTQTFHFNDKTFLTDHDTLKLLRSFKDNREMFKWTFLFGTAYGVIVEVV